MSKIKVAYIVPEQTWLGSITLGQDMLTVAGNFWAPNNQHDKSPRFEFHLLNPESKSLTAGFSGTPLPTKALDKTSYDIIVLPAVWSVSNELLSKYTRLFQWLREQNKKETQFIGVVNGMFFLAEAGLLNGKTANTHWSMRHLFKLRYPKVNLDPTQLYISSGNMHCSTSINATLDLLLEIIEKYCDEDIATQCKHYFFTSKNFDYDSVQQQSHSQKTNDKLVLAVQEWINQNYSQNINLEELALQFNTSTRTLVRHFKKETDITPTQYIQQQRIHTAQKLLLNSTIPIEIVAQRCGYNSNTVFGRVFKQETGLSPLSYRHSR